MKQVIYHYAAGIGAVDDFYAIPVIRHNHGYMEDRRGGTASKKNQVTLLCFFQWDGAALFGLIARAGAQLYVEITHHIAGESGTIEAAFRRFARCLVVGSFKLLGKGNHFAPQIGFGIGFPFFCAYLAQSVTGRNSDDQYKQAYRLDKTKQMRVHQDVF